LTNLFCELGIDDINRYAFDVEAGMVNLINANSTYNSDQIIDSDANTIFIKVKTKQKIIIIYLIAIKDIPAGQELLVD
jgi:hypothetical protein